MLPSEEYVQRRTERASRVARFEKIHIRLGNLRLFLAVIAAVLAWASFRAHYLSPWWLIAPVVAFVMLGIWHSRVLRSRELAERAVVFYERGLARIEDRWAGTGETGERFADPHHVYSGDLDLFGDASLFQLLSSARTRMGEETLARWLLTPSKLDEIRKRQAVMGELRPELDLREDLAVLGEDAGVGVHPEDLVKWAESPNQMTALWLAWAAPVLALFAVSSAIVWAVWDIATPFVAVVVIEAILTYRLKASLEALLHGTENAFHDLDLLSGVLARVESHQFSRSGAADVSSASFCRADDRVAGDCKAAIAGGPDQLAAQHICAHHRCSADVFGAGGVCSRTLAAKRTVSAVRKWAAAVGELEALLSLAGLQLRTSCGSVSGVC